MVMEPGHTHIMVPLLDWNTIKKHVDILTMKGREVIQISDVVKCMMDAIDNDQPGTGVGEPEMKEFGEPGEVGEPVPETYLTVNAGTPPELPKKHPKPSATPPPPKLLLEAARTGPCANMVPPKENRPWRRAAPYTKTSCGSTSSWDTHERWA